MSAKQSPSKAAKKSEDKVTRNIVIATVVFVFLFVGGGIVLSKQNEGTVSQAIPSSVDESNGFGITFNKGLTDVPKIDIYQDFQCPVCQQFEAVNFKYIDSLVTEKKAVVTYHPLSFLGTESQRAANAAACAADEDEFLSFQATMYANFPAEKNSGEWSNERIIDIGRTAGITSSSFADCVNNGEYAGWVERVAESGRTAGVNSTPTVFVNGKEINRETDYFSVVNFKRAVEG